MGGIACRRKGGKSGIGINQAGVVNKTHTSEPGKEWMKNGINALSGIALGAAGATA